MKLGLDSPHFEFNSRKAEYNLFSGTPSRLLSKLNPSTYSVLDPFQRIYTTALTYTTPKGIHTENNTVTLALLNFGVLILRHRRKQIKLMERLREPPLCGCHGRELFAPPRICWLFVIFSQVLFNRDVAGSYFDGKIKKLSHGPDREYEK